MHDRDNNDNNIVNNTEASAHRQYCLLCTSHQKSNRFAYLQHWKSRTKCSTIETVINPNSGQPTTDFYPTKWTEVSLHHIFFNIFINCKYNSHNKINPDTEDTSKTIGRNWQTLPLSSHCVYISFKHPVFDSSSSSGSITIHRIRHCCKPTYTDNKCCIVSMTMSIQNNL